MKYFILILSLLITLQLSFSQTVVGEPDLTESELKQQQLLSQGYEYSIKYSRAIAELNLIVPSKNYNPPNSIPQLDRAIKGFEKALSSLASSKAYFYAQQNDILYRNAGKGNLANKIADFNDKKSRFNNALTKAKNKKIEITQNKKKQQAKVDFLAQDTKMLEKKTEDLKKKNNSNSDFLSKSSASSNDFLSKSNSSSNDFLSPSGSKDGEITYRDGKQGVVNKATGKTLIPFKDWRIQKFQSGIALVEIKVDDYNKKCSGADGSYQANAYKSGFVDHTGTFVDGYEITFSGGWKDKLYLRLNVGSDNRSSEEKAAARKRSRQRKALAQEECREAYLAWKENIINTYN